VDERVLLVEDDASIREMAERGLTGAGFRVTTCADGQEGLERLRRDAFDPAVLDVMLPSLDRFEITREIRKVSRIPIVMLTARMEVIITVGDGRIRIYRCEVCVGVDALVSLAQSRVTRQLTTAERAKYLPR
jgi:CheY-like chemotaxis protein